MVAAFFFPLGVECDTYEELVRFISIVSGVSPISESAVTNNEPRVQHFIIHARKCILKGLGTKENRSVPPLQYSWVFRCFRLVMLTFSLLDDFPSIDFSINGGIRSYSEMKILLNRESYF